MGLLRTMAATTIGGIQSKGFAMALVMHGNTNERA
jgi:hypothetical protein